jgi:hypothetical protein
MILILIIGIAAAVTVATDLTALLRRGRRGSP